MATQTTEEHSSSYFVPTPVPWPFMMTASLIVMLVGASIWMNGSDIGRYVFYLGVLMVFSMAFVWFRGVINESLAGMYRKQEDMAFRFAMSWFIFSEVMFFGAFFGALFYIRIYAVPWLSGEGNEFFTHFYLWPQFEGGWPSNGPANVGGEFATVSAWELPLINTLLLLTSSITVTVAHWGIKENNRFKLILGLAATVLLAVTFLFCQATEYIEAYKELGLTLGSGVYGSTFFMLTGFHGAHVTLGTIMLSVILLRSLKGHFSSDDHFGFEAVSWYWHFVDVVWLVLFIFVYVL